jgi:cysteine desulfurase family protein (TIGR01976 family)
MLDIDRVRAGYPALAEGLVHLDGPGGTQVAGVVADAVAASLRSAVSNRHGPFASSVRADAAVDAARMAVADLAGGDPRGVILGPNMTTLTFVLAGSLAKTWSAGDEVVVTRLDHDANVRPWVLAAERVGATVRWADFDPETCELPVGQYDDLVSSQTRLVAVTAASNAVGTRPDVRAIADRAHAAGALVYVDGVHAAPHVPLDVAELGADFFALSSYKFGGPHLGAVVADPGLLESLRPDKLIPSPADVPDQFETGTPPFELYAGLAATVDHLADLLPGPGNRRERVLRSMAAVADYEAELVGKLLAGLGEVPGVTIYGAPARRTPTVAFRLAGRAPREVTECLGGEGICAWDGNYYAVELMRRLGLEDTGGAVRVGLVHYNTAAEVDRLLAVLRGLG